MRAIVSEKGQVTIPKPLRDRIGIAPGAVFEFQEEAGMLIASNARGEDVIVSVYGYIDVDRPVDELVEALRGRDPDA